MNHYATCMTSNHCTSIRIRTLISLSVVMYSNPLNYGSNFVGVIRLELMTSSLSVKCSNHLSYTPKLCCFCLGQHNGQHKNHEEFFDRAFGPHNCVLRAGLEPARPQWPQDLHTTFAFTRTIFNITWPDVVVWTISLPY